MNHEEAFPNCGWCAWCAGRIALLGPDCPVTQAERDAEVARLESALWNPLDFEGGGIVFWTAPQPNHVVEGKP